MGFSFSWKIYKCDVQREGGGELDVFKVVNGRTNTAQNRKEKAVHICVIHLQCTYNGFKITYTVLGL